MPTIKPTSVKDLDEFVAEHRKELLNGTYDISIDSKWIEDVPDDLAGFAVSHCDRETSVRFSKRKNVGPKLQSALAKCKYSDARYFIAENPSVSEIILFDLSKDEESVYIGDSTYMVCYAVAQNQNTSSRALQNLSKHWDDHIRRQVANHPNTPESQLELLARDSNMYVRRAVVGNKNASRKILNLLSKDLEQIRSEENRRKLLRVREFINGFVIPAIGIGLITALVAYFFSEYWALWAIVIGLLWGLLVWKS